MISVICPVLNEQENIEKLLSFFDTAQPRDKELLVIDGGSTDGTVDIVLNWCKNHDNVRLLHNPVKFVPYALNKGIKSSSGDPIIRLDAHTEYAADYFMKIIQTFNKTDADIVGGPMNAVGKNNFQTAVALATTTVFGIGDSKIHQTAYEGESDHVYLGAWKRKLFTEIGFFDERLKRNQDDEFHYRARSKGKKIYLNPQIKSYYYPRSSYLKLIKQYFQYGLYKPIVLKKIRSEIKIRHIVPSLFSIYLLSLPLTVVIKFYLIPLIVYLLTDLYFSIRLKSEIEVKIYSLLIYPSIHLSYGIGLLIGLFNTNNEE